MNRVICAVLLALMPVLTAAAAEPRIPAAKKKLILQLFEVTDAKDNTTDAIIEPGPYVANEMCNQGLFVWPFEAARCGLP